MAAKEDMGKNAWLASCQPMMTTLRRLTLNVEENRPSSLPVKIFFTFYLIGNSQNLLKFSSAAGVFVLSIFNSDQILFRPLNFNEPLIAFSLMVFFVLRRRHIARLIGEIIEMTSSLNTNDLDNDGRGQKDMRWTSRMLASFTCFCVLLNLLLGLYLCAFLHLPKGRYVLDTFYFGLVIPEGYELTFLKLDVTCFFTTANTYGTLQGMLLIFVFSLLANCFRQLNRSLEIRSRDCGGLWTDCGFVYAVVRKHQELATLVTKVNELFSLAIFFYVIFAILRVVIMLKFLAFQTKGFAVHDYSALYFGSVFTMVTLMTLTLWYACRIHVEAQETTEILLKLNLKNSVCCNSQNKSRKFKECHVTSLYLAQQTVLPVGIRFGRLFCIDYPFILFMLSTIVTYLTAISAVE